MSNIVKVVCKANSCWLVPVVAWSHLSVRCSFVTKILPYNDYGTKFYRNTGLQTAEKVDYGMLIILNEQIIFFALIKVERQLQEFVTAAVLFYELLVEYFDASFLHLPVPTIPIFSIKWCFISIQLKEPI